MFIGRQQEWDRALIEMAFSACKLTPTELRKGPDQWRTLPDRFPEWTDEEVLTEENMEVERI